MVEYWINWRRHIDVTSLYPYLQQTFLSIIIWCRINHIWATSNVSWSTRKKRLQKHNDVFSTLRHNATYLQRSLPSMILHKPPLSNGIVGVPKCHNLMSYFDISRIYNALLFTDCPRRAIGVYRTIYHKNLVTSGVYFLYFLLWKKKIFIYFFDFCVWLKTFIQNAFFSDVLY